MYAVVLLLTDAVGGGGGLDIMRLAYDGNGGRVDMVRVCRVGSTQPGDRNEAGSAGDTTAGMGVTGVGPVGAEQPSGGRAADAVGYTGRGWHPPTHDSRLQSAHDGEALNDAHPTVGSGGGRLGDR